MSAEEAPAPVPLAGFAYRLGISQSRARKYLRELGATWYEEWWIYRVYDEADRLLYLGVTKDWERRRSEHSRAPWWPEAHHITVTAYGADKAAAYDAEANAIVDERPLYNGTERPRHPNKPLAVCTSPGCSLRMRWYDYGVRRICRQCARDHGRLEEFG